MRLSSTQRQAEMLAAIRRLTVDGVPPSLEALGSAVGLQSRGNVHGLLARMRARGLVAWEPGRARTIRIVEDTWSGLDRLSTAELTALRIRIDVLLTERAPQ